MIALRYELQIYVTDRWVVQCHSPHTEQVLDELHRWGRVTVTLPTRIVRDDGTVMWANEAAASREDCQGALATEPEDLPTMAGLAGERIGNPFPPPPQPHPAAVKVSDADPFSIVMALDHDGPCERGETPYHQHAVPDLARAEARRLAKLHGGRFSVLTTSYVVGWVERDLAAEGTVPV